MSTECGEQHPEGAVIHSRATCWKRLWRAHGHPDKPCRIGAPDNPRVCVLAPPDKVDR